MTADTTHRKVVNFFDSGLLLGSAETNAADSTFIFAAAPNEWMGRASSTSAPLVAAGDTTAQSSSFTIGTAPPITVADGATAEIDGVSAQSVTFTGTTGTLKLDDAVAFAGQVSGLAGSDALDLADLSYGPNTTATFSGNINGGTLTVTNGTETANIALVGDYLKSGWTLSSDGHGGTVVVDPTEYPNATNTGVSAGTILTPAASNTISQPGVYNGLHFTGTVNITASNVTLENCLITGVAGDQEEIEVSGNVSNVVIQNCEVAGAGSSGQEGSMGIYVADNSQVTINACNIHDVAAGVEVSDGRIILENSYIHNLNGGAGSHIDGFFFGGGTSPDFSVLIQGNSIINENDQTDAVMIQNIFGDATNITVNNNLLVSGGYIVYSDGSKSSAPITDISFTNNHMGAGPGYYGDTDFINNTPTYTGNVDDGGTLLAALPVSPVVSEASAIAGNYSTGNTLTLTLYASEAVTVSGKPTLTLNDGGTATYTGGSGTNALTFSYTVGSGQSTNALAVTGVNGTITDLDGNALSTSNLPAAFTGVTIASNGVPIITAFSPDSGTVGDDITNATVLKLTGTAVANSTVNVYDGTTLLGTAAANTTGAWNFTTGTLSNGTHSFTATDTVSGVTSATSPTFAVTVDTVAPPAPVIGSDVINTSVVTLTGTGQASSTVTVFNGTTQLGTAAVNGSGAWSFATGSLANGNYSFSATDTDAAGNVSTASSPLNVTVNAPPNLVTNGSFETDSFTGWTLGGNDAGAQIVIDGRAEQGNYAAEMGSVGSNGSISQAISTTPGQEYQLTFWLANDPNGAAATPNDFTAKWNGTTLLSLTNAPQQGYTEYTYDVVATSSSTTLEFDARQDPSFWNLDNISVTALGPVAPAVSSLVESPSSGDLNAGKTVTLTLAMSENVTVNTAGGKPTLALNDGTTASYVSSSGNTLTFSYTVAAGQNIAALAATTVNLNGATITDGAGNAANLSLTGLTQSGPQIDTTPPVISSIAETPTSGDLNAGKTVTYTIGMSENVTVNTAGGKPTLTLNDGGTATYTSGSGTNALTFTYTVAAGQNTPDLQVNAVNLNGATITDNAGNATNLSLTGLAQGSPQIDTTTPTISSVVELPSSGDLGAGKTVTLTLSMSENATVNTTGGTPTLTLNDGTTATYTSGSGTSALTFSYTVATGQNTAALAATAVNLNGATIADGAGNAANLSLSGLTQTGPQIDTTPPVISSIAETPSSGDLDAGKTVTLTLNMNGNVTVNTAGGTPTLTLNDGTTATYTSGSGTSALTFSYTVAAGQNIAALAATTVNLNGATIQDGAGNAANLSLTGLTQTGPQIDTTAPTVSSLVESPSSGDLNAGKTVTLTLAMSENVTVNTAGGKPTLALNDGTTASYVSSSGDTLTFSYTVAAGQNIAALAATAVNLNGATIQDGAGNAANLSLTGLTQTGPQIDTTAPTVSSVVESPASGDLDAGKTVTLTLNMNGNVTVNTAGGTPTLTLNDGTTATYTSSSGTSALTFSYTVAAGQNIAALAATTVNLNGATIQDGAGNAANLSLTGLTQTGPQIDTTVPSVTGVAASPSSGTEVPGNTITLTVSMSEAVMVTGTPTLSLNDGGTATYQSSSGNTLTFSYTVGAGDNPVSALAITQANLPNGATITDAAGNAANLAGAVTTFSGLPIDPPANLNSIVESPASGDLDSGKTITLTLNMNENVTVNTDGGTPTLALNDGGTAIYQSSSGNVLTFTYTVGASDSNVASLSATAINLNGATVQDGAGNTANLSLSGLTQSGPQIDTTTPTVTAVTESPSSGDLNAGKTVTLTLAMSENVTVNTAGGKPTLALNDGTTASYVSSSGNTLTFSYTVGANDSNVASLSATGINLNGATIQDGAGNAANLSLTGLTQSGPQIDTTPPVISSIAETPTSGDLNAGKTVTYTIGMSENVTVNTAGGKPTLTLNDGGTATYTSGSGTNALTFTYTVAAGQNTPDLQVNAVNLNGATITDNAGNATNLSLTGLAQGSPQIDTTMPTVASVSATAGDYIAGNTLTLTLAMSENVTVSGNPTLTLNDGGIASYVSGSGTNTLTFSYTVASGQNTPALQVTAVNGTIADLAGNALSLSNLPETFTGVVINTTTTPVVSSVVESPATGDLNAGKTVTLTLKMSDNVTVSGKPTLKLNDGGTATYIGGSGTNTLTFSYTVAAGQNTAALAVATVNLNGATITNGGNAANLSLAGLTQTGPQIDTIAPAAPKIGSDLLSGNVATLTGTAEAGTTVTVFDWYKRLGTATVNSSGTWSFATGSLATGFHTFTATDTDAAGNVSKASASLSAMVKGPVTASNPPSVTIVGGGTFEISSASADTVTFAGSTGTLKLDAPSTFSGKIFNFRGNGTLSGSDQIDLTNINFHSVKDTYANGVLTVTDGTNTDKLTLNGSYTLANFSFASDGSGGTIVYDPPAATSCSQNGSTAAGTSGAATIGTGKTFELPAGDPAPVAFTGSSGTLIIDGSASAGHALDFTGPVSGFGGQNVIDLPGIAFDAQTTLGYSTNSDQTGGTLSLADGTHCANIALLGNYMASCFTAAGDGHGGTVVVAEAPQAGDQSLLSNPHHT